MSWCTATAWCTCATASGRVELSGCRSPSPALTAGLGSPGGERPPLPRLRPAREHGPRRPGGRVGVPQRMPPPPHPGPAQLSTPSPGARRTRGCAVSCRTTPRSPRGRPVPWRSSSSPRRTSSSCSTWPRAGASLDAMLLRRAATATPPRPDVARALARLVATDGSLRIAALAAELGCSRRHLSASFHSELGLAPKAYARILRFRRATALLDQRRRARASRRGERLRGPAAPQPGVPRPGWPDAGHISPRPRPRGGVGWRS